MHHHLEIESVIYHREFWHYLHPDLHTGTIKKRKSVVCFPCSAACSFCDPRSSLAQSIGRQMFSELFPMIWQMAHSDLLVFLLYLLNLEHQEIHSAYLLTTTSKFYDVDFISR